MRRMHDAYWPSKLWRHTRAALRWIAIVALAYVVASCVTAVVDCVHEMSAEGLFAAGPDGTAAVGLWSRLMMKFAAARRSLGVRMALRDSTSERLESISKEELMRRIRTKSHVLIAIPSRIKDHETIFNHPYSLLYHTRRCLTPCSFLGVEDSRVVGPVGRDRPFTQAGMDHVWLRDGRQLKRFGRLAHAVLHSDHVRPPEDWSKTFSTPATALQCVIESVPRAPHYHHDPSTNLSKTDPDLPYFMGQSGHVPMPPGDADGGVAELRVGRAGWADILVGFPRGGGGGGGGGRGGEPDIRMNLVTRVYSSFSDFVAMMRPSSSSVAVVAGNSTVVADGAGAGPGVGANSTLTMDTNLTNSTAVAVVGRPWSKRFHGIAVYTPPCEMLHAGALSFLVRLQEAGARAKVVVHLMGGCMRDPRRDGSLDGKVWNEGRRTRTAGAYLMVLVWQGAVVDDMFFKALGWQTLIAVWGGWSEGGGIVVGDEYVPHATGLIRVSHQQRGGVIESDGGGIGTVVGGAEGLVEFASRLCWDEMEWYRLMAWRDVRGWLFEHRFRKLWSWTVEKAVCGLCEAVAERVGIRRSPESSGPGGDDLESILEINYVGREEKAMREARYGAASEIE